MGTCSPVHNSKMSLVPLSKKVKANLETPEFEKQKIKDETTDKKGESVFFNEKIDWWKDIIDEKIYKTFDYCGKMVLLLDILSMSSKAGEKALVFIQSLTTLDMTEQFLSKLPRSGTENKYWKQGKDWYRTFKIWLAQKGMKWKNLTWNCVNFGGRKDYSIKEIDEMRGGPAKFIMDIVNEDTMC